MNLPQLALAQVDTVFADEGTLSLTFPHLAMLSGVRAKVAQEGASARGGSFSLPQRGDYGLVSFYQNDPRSCEWICTITSATWHSLPLELWKDDPQAVVTYSPSGTQHIRHGSGDVEVACPDGTLIRLSHTKDGTPGNAGRSVAVTPRKVSEPQGQARTPGRVPYTPAPLPPADLVVQHASGATLRLTADGSLSVRTARGHTLRLHDATEKARSAEDGSVTAQPEEDAQRVASEVEVLTEQGHRIVLHDDPLKALDRYVRIDTAGGHRFELRDKPDSDVRATLRTTAGHQIELRDKPSAQAGAEVKTAGGLSVKLEDTPKKITVKGETVVVDATKVLLGSEGANRAVALHGDIAKDPDGTDAVIQSSAVKVFAE